MPTPTKGPRLGGSPTHQRIILANLATQLFEHGSIVTTETKAKRGDLHARRTVMKTITDPSVVHVLFTEIAPVMEGRDGGYTRITKIGNRQGDNAPMAKIEIITEMVAPKAPAAQATTTGSADELKAQVEAAKAADVTTGEPQEDEAQAIADDVLTVGISEEVEEPTEADAAQADLDAAAAPVEQADKA